MKTINDENYFEYAEAIHCYATLHHGGQSSALYSILSISEFQPGPLWTETKCEQENYVYAEIDDSNIEALADELSEFLSEQGGE